jgi:hypothetical protein
MEIVKSLLVATAFCAGIAFVVFFGIRAIILSVHKIVDIIKNK